jgi:hypothetical protein
MMFVPKQKLGRNWSIRERNGPERMKLLSNIRIGWKYLPFLDKEVQKQSDFAVLIFDAAV